MKDVLDRIDAHVRAVFGRGVWRPGRVDASGPLADFHRVADGGLEEDPTFGSFTLLGVDEAAAEKRMMDQLAIDEAWEKSWWSPTWHPFGSDRCGQLLVVDADSGRVIEFLHDDDARPEHAVSLAAWFADIAARLDDGRLVVDLKRGVQSPEDIAADLAFAAARAAREAATAQAVVAEMRRAKTMAVVGAGIAVVFMVLTIVLR